VNVTLFDSAGTGAELPQRSKWRYPCAQISAKIPIDLGQVHLAIGSIGVSRIEP
jgi:hypothetical protein